MALTAVHRVLGCALVAVTLLGGGGCAEEDTAAEVPKIRRNLLLVTLDTTRADRLSCYGYPRTTTPNMDALASDGIRFDLAIAQAALTPVSHASIVTGLLPAQHGVRVAYAASGCSLPRDVPSLGTVLRSRGFKTGAFMSSFTVSEFYGFDNGFDTFDNGLGHSSDNVFTEQSDGSWNFDMKPNQRRSDRTTDQAIAWLGETKEPFFLWVHYWDPHDPHLRPPDDVVASFAAPPGASQTDRLRALYDAEVFYVDQQFGRLLQTLKEQDRYRDTIIVVVADHGQGLGDHQHWAHRILYQEQIRVPLIMRFPGGPAGRVVPELVRTVDIYPTVLESLGVAPPGNVDGDSLHGLASGASEAPRLAYAETLMLYDLSAKGQLLKRPDDDLLHCLMDRSWKLIYRPRHPERSELYHLREDPRETKNLYGQRPEQVKRLLAAMNNMDPFVNQPFGETHDQEVMDRLRSLGYVGD